MVVLIKTLFEFSRFFKLQNVVKKTNSFQYKLEGGFGCIFGIQVDRTITGEAVAHKRKFTVEHVEIKACVAELEHLKLQIWRSGVQAFAGRVVSLDKEPYSTLSPFTPATYGWG